MSFTNELKSHSVQIAYCVDCNGNLRIFVEHWHGSENPNSTNMTISLNVNNVITTQTQPPAFGLINVPFASLPGCVTPVTSVGGCPGQITGRAIARRSAGSHRAVRRPRRATGATRGFHRSAPVLRQ